MHAVMGGWAGQAFAVAASNDSGGKKARIRRSKEERKEMVISFIKKYQKFNDGNFPSLNLTHKEVGGSFYIVREIVREVIQENRVLAPPKISAEAEEQGQFEFVEQHPLGSISVEPQIDLSVSDGTNMATHVMPNEYQITSEETFSNSSVQFNGSYPLGLVNVEIGNVGSKVADVEEAPDETSKSYHVSDHYEDTSMKDVSSYTEELPQPKNHEFENEQIVNGIEVLDKNVNSDHRLISNVDHKDNNDIAVEPRQKLKGPASQRLNNEQYPKKNDHPDDKTKESGERICVEPAVMEILDTGKHGAHNVEASQAEKNVNSDNRLLSNVDHKDNNDIAVEPSQKLKGPASRRLNNEQYHNKNNHPVDKTKEFGERISVVPALMEILDRGKHGAHDVEASQAEKNVNSYHRLISNVDHKDNNDIAVEPSQKLKGPASQRLNNEQYHNKNDHPVDKTKEFGERISVEPAVMEILDSGKHGAHNVEASQPVKPYMTYDVVVETFPTRPVTRSIHNVDGESGKLHGAAGTLENRAIQPDEEKLPDSTVGLNGECRDESMVLNVQIPSLESSKSSSAFQSSVLDIGDNADLESKVSLPNGTKASDCTELLSSKASIAVEKKSSDQDNSSLSKANNPDEINLEMSEGASTNSTQPESNPLLALVKAFISSFIKFWTE